MVSDVTQDSQSFKHKICFEYAIRDFEMTLKKVPKMAKFGQKVKGLALSRHNSAKK